MGVPHFGYPPPIRPGGGGYLNGGYHTSSKPPPLSDLAGGGGVPRPVGMPLAFTQEDFLVFHTLGLILSSLSIEAVQTNVFIDSKILKKMFEDVEPFRMDAVMDSSGSPLCATPANLLVSLYIIHHSKHFGVANPAFSKVDESRFIVRAFTSVRSLCVETPYPRALRCLDDSSHLLLRNVSRSIRRHACTCVCMLTASNGGLGGGLDRGLPEGNRIDPIQSSNKSFKVTTCLVLVAHCEEYCL